jgi:hypothetical protein
MQRSFEGPSWGEWVVLVAVVAVSVGLYAITAHLQRPGDLPWLLFRGALGFVPGAVLGQMATGWLLGGRVSAGHASQPTRRMSAPARLGFGLLGLAMLIAFHPGFPLEELWTMAGLS